MGRSGPPVSAGSSYGGGGPGRFPPGFYHLGRSGPPPPPPPTGPSPRGRPRREVGVLRRITGPLPGNQSRQVQEFNIVGDDAQERQRQPTPEDHIQSVAYSSTSSPTLSESLPGPEEHGHTDLISGLTDESRISHVASDHKTTERSLTKSSSSNCLLLPEGDFVLQLMQRIKELEAENAELRPPPNGLAADVQVFHCLLDDEQSYTSNGSDVDDQGNPEVVYLSEPYWEKQGKDIILKGRLSVPDPEGYIKNKGNIIFTIYKFYTVKHQRSQIGRAMKANKPLPKPEPIRQGIRLNSVEMIEAMKSFFDQYPKFRSEFSEVDEDKSICSPYIWWYHWRTNGHTHNLQPGQAILVAKLTDWIEANYASLYDQIDRKFDKGLVSKESMEYLIRPGDVLISNDNGRLSGCLATSRPRFDVGQRALEEKDKHNPKPSWSWSIDSYAFMYAGKFRREDENIDIVLETECEDVEVDITSLNVVPLKYVSDDIRETLLRRGKRFWKCRHKQFVSYEGNSTNKRRVVCNMASICSPSLLSPPSPYILLLFKMPNK